MASPKGQYAAYVEVPDQDSIFQNSVYAFSDTLRRSASALQAFERVMTSGAAGVKAERTNRLTPVLCTSFTGAGELVVSLSATSSRCKAVLPLSQQEPLESGDRLLAWVREVGELICRSSPRRSWR